jgi:hypothetical protein
MNESTRNHLLQMLTMGYENAILMYREGHSTQTMKQKRFGSPSLSLLELVWH